MLFGMLRDALIGPVFTGLLFLFMGRRLPLYAAPLAQIGAAAGMLAAAVGVQGTGALHAIHIAAAGALSVAVADALLSGRVPERLVWVIRGAAAVLIGWYMLPQNTEIWPGLALVAVAAAAAGPEEAPDWSSRLRAAGIGALCAVALLNGGSARLSMIALGAGAAATLTGSTSPLPMLLLALLGHWYAGLTDAALLALCVVIGSRLRGAGWVGAVWVAARVEVPSV